MIYAITDVCESVSFQILSMEQFWDEKIHLVDSISRGFWQIPVQEDSASLG